MSRSHHKRLVMPRTWPLTRKTNIWAQKPNPSGHQIEMCMPLGIILRDVLGVAHNMREAKSILHARSVMVDGKVETDRARGVGLMDVLTVGEAPAMRNDLTIQCRSRQAAYAIMVTFASKPRQLIRRKACRSSLSGHPKRFAGNPRLTLGRRRR